MARVPNAKAANWRRLQPALEAVYREHPPSVPALLNAAEALVNAASCASCAFYERGQCRANPPETSLEDGRPIWPAVPSGEWCGAWAQAWSPT